MQTITFPAGREDVECVETVLPDKEEKRAMSANKILMLDKAELLRVPGGVEEVEELSDGAVAIWISFYAYGACGECFIKNTDIDAVRQRVILRGYGDNILRLIFDPGESAELETPMLTEDMPEPTGLQVESVPDGYLVKDLTGRKRALINCAEIAVSKWSDLLPAVEKMPEITLFPDGETAVPLKCYDMFAHGRIESLPLGYIEKEGSPKHTVFAFQADADECFGGTGERFAKMDLAGQTMVLENDDGMGVNSPRCYKNIPFYISGRPYGVFIHSSSKIRLSLAAVSTRAAQARVCEPVADIFVIGGGSTESVLRNYGSLTGTAPKLPLWSYGVWMARMTYFSADEVREIAAKMREHNFPCDVMHIDTGWFATDWVCDWKFCEKEFPEPVKFLDDMREMGYRISLWQTPDVSCRSSIADAARERGCLPKVTTKREAGSDFSQQDIIGQIDFSNPEAVDWYQNDLLRPLLEMGVAVIKTDFGENIIMESEYYGLPASKLRNRYALLYHKAAFEISEKVYGKDNALIWARAGWAGCQRYPLHWGGDAESSWEGMAATLRGGLHLGMSGFTYWSHDIPGFHGSPDFMNSRPSDNLYVRWTQFGVFSSHMRYHGASPREPYLYPEISDTVREWLKLRYALIPYIKEQADKASDAGLPLLRALVLFDDKDPVCRQIDSEYMFGEDFLAAPIMNDSGVRDIYLPQGRWIDFWTGELIEGRQWLYRQNYPLHRMPLFVRAGAEVPVYPEAVRSTNDMQSDKISRITVERGFKGLQVCSALWEN